MTWIIAIISFAIGLCAGAVLFRQFKLDTAKVAALQAELDQARKELDQYKEGVNQHFHTTADLFTNLTDNYRALYQHMASSAKTLCPDDTPAQLSLEQPNAGLGFSTSNAKGAGKAGENAGDIDPPRDYATKTRPDQKGNLAEDYGLKREA